MSLYNSFDRNQHFAELNFPLQNAGSTGSGWLSANQRKQRAQTNLGINTGSLFGQITPATVNATVTMTAANILSGLITTSTAAAVSATLPLATDLDTAVLAQQGGLPLTNAGAAAYGASFSFHVVNTGPNTFTILTNTGWTLVGNMAVATAVSAEFLAYRTAAGAWTIQKV